MNILFSIIHLIACFLTGWGVGRLLSLLGKNKHGLKVGTIYYKYNHSYREICYMQIQNINSSGITSTDVRYNMEPTDEMATQTIKRDLQNAQYSTRLSIEAFKIYLTANEWRITEI